MALAVRLTVRIYGAVRFTVRCVPGASRVLTESAVDLASLCAVCQTGSSRTLWTISLFHFCCPFQVHSEVHLIALRSLFPSHKFEHASIPEESDQQCAYWAYGECLESCPSQDGRSSVSADSTM